MKFSLQLAERLHASREIGRRALVGTLYSPGIYLVTALALLAASTLVLNNLAFLDENGLLVLIRPFFLPIFVCTLLISLYLALHATLHLVREQEQKTLRVLLFGPVDGVSYLLGRLWSQTLLYGLAAAVLLVWAICVGAFTGLLVHADLLAVLGIGLLANGALVAFGLMVGAWGRTARTTLVLFLLAILLALFVQFGEQALVVLASQRPATWRDPLAFLRAGLAVANGLLLWFSPFAQMGRGMDALLAGENGRLLFHCGAIVVQATLYFVGADWALKRGDL